MKKLSARERVFVDEYLVNLKPEQAALKAGYAKSTANTKAYTWVRESKCPANKLHVLHAITAAKAKRNEITGIDAAWILKRLALLANFNINRFMTVSSSGLPYYDFSAATDDDWYCISEITTDQIMKGFGDDTYEVERVKLKSESKLKALELMGRHVDVQAFSEKIEVDVTDRAGILEAARKRAGGK